MNFEQISKVLASSKDKSVKKAAAALKDLAALNAAEHKKKDEAIEILKGGRRKEKNKQLKSGGERVAKKKDAKFKDPDKSESKKQAAIEADNKKEIDKLKAKLAEEKNKRFASLTKESLLAELAKHSITKPEVIYPLFLGKVKVDENTEALVVQDEKHTSLDELIGAWAKENTWAVSAGQKPGAATTAGSSSSAKEAQEDPGVAFARSLGKEKAAQTGTKSIENTLNTYSLKKN